MHWTLLIESAALLVVGVAFVGLTSLTRSHQRLRPVLMVALGAVGMLLMLAVLLQEGGG